MEDLYMGILGKTPLESIAELWITIRDLKSRLDSPTYGPMIEDDPEEPHS